MLARNQRQRRRRRHTGGRGSEAYRAPTALYRTESPSMVSLGPPALGVAILPATLWRLVSAMVSRSCHCALPLRVNRRCAHCQLGSSFSAVTQLLGLRRSPKTGSPGLPSCKPQKSRGGGEKGRREGQRSAHAKTGLVGVRARDKRRRRMQVRCRTLRGRLVCPSEGLAVRGLAVGGRTTFT